MLTVYGNIWDEEIKELGVLISDYYMLVLFVGAEDLKDEKCKERF